MNCEKCGNSLSLNAKFCTKCGESVRGATIEVIDAGKKKKPIIKCGNCGYVGEAESNRSILAQILAWLCLFIFPIITILYFGTTKKYSCPKCKSTFVGVKDKTGIFVDQKTSVLKIVVFLLLGIALISTVAGMVITFIVSQNPVESQYSTGWTTYNAVSDGFSILVPNSPSFESSNGTTDSGISYEYHSYSAEKGSEYFLVAKYIYSEPTDVSNPDNFLEKLMNGFMSGSESKLVNSNYTIHKSYRSLDFTSKTTSETFMGRILLIGETPYLLIVGYPTGSNGSFDYIKFVESFEIK